MLKKIDRQQIRATCRLYGGIKAVADKAGVDDGNLSRWLRGQPTLSEEKAADVLYVLGIPAGQPDASRVHTWRIKSVTFKDYVPALKTYFPNGAQIAGASWSQPGFQNPAKMLLPSKYKDNIFALTDGTIRAVLRLPRSIIIQKENIGSHVRWRNGTRAKSILNITEEDEAWAHGAPTIDEFDSVWSEIKRPISPQGILQAVEDEGISYEEAIQRIRRKD